MTVISMENGKVLDVEPLSKVCKTCEKHEDDSDATEHEPCKANHQPKCKANYTGSSPAMEPVGARQIFNRSVSTRNLQYTEFYGDGDSKSLKISTRKTMARLFRKRNVWVMSKSGLVQHYGS